jgi:hypothetical protein
MFFKKIIIIFNFCFLSLISCSKTKEDCCIIQPDETINPEETKTAVDCNTANSLSTVGVDCPFSAPDNSIYNETIVEGIRNIQSNTVPNHIYGDFRGRFAPFYRSFTLTVSPSLSNQKTSILNASNRPRYFFGVATNGIVYAPAPATPFIFENSMTGEYNWDWVFEASMNKGPDGDQVKLDCANAHSGDQGYHYHGNMFAFAETLLEGISSNNATPTEAIQVGWAADGFPIVYLYGPNSNGDLVKLSSSYRLKNGDRPGDGITAPCGTYNGKYYNDYEYIPYHGDLDMCNGIERMITINTPSGQEIFSYFYVITEKFPQIGRCFSGTPDDSFL